MAKWKTISKKKVSKPAPAETYIDPVTGYKITVCKPVAAPKIRTANC